MNAPRTPAAGLGVALLGLLVTSLPVAAQDTAPDKVTRAEVHQVVDSLARTLVALYVFPDVGNQLAADLRRRMAAGEYDAVGGGDALASRLTADMASIAHDKHLNVNYTAGKESWMNERPSPEEEAKRQRWSRARNYGFEKVERLPGNIGYLEVRGFMPVASMRETALAAMRFLGNTDALIIDLRRNGGGEPDAVALLSSWLFPRGKKVHLNDLYWRKGNRTEQYFTDPSLPVPEFKGPVYVLTSTRTFSAAEEFTYNLKQLKRATQVGETSGGGANPGEGVILSRNFGVFIPTGRAINPVTGDNWEGKGAVPEIPTPADDALRTAHMRAIEGLMANEQDPDMKRAYEMALAELRRTT